MDEDVDIQSVMQAVYEKMLEFHCGTPFLKTLQRAIEAYKNGGSISDGVEAKEVEIEFMPEWEVAGQYSSGEEPFQDVYYPVTLVDGVKTPTFLDIVDYTPVEGHRSTIKAIQFSIRGCNQYLFKEVISDVYVREPVIPDYLKEILAGNLDE